MNNFSGIPDFEESEELKLENLLAPLGPEGQKIAFHHLPAIFAPLLAAIKKINPLIVTVAGTNGKGETIYRLQQALRGQGWTTAMWISPHILSLRERITLNGAMLPYSSWQALLTQTRNALAQIGQGLSYYEFLFYAFLLAVLEARPQVLLLEVGMGGRLDAVNLLDADLSVLPSIGRDHQAFLGSSYRAILGEKLGVTRPGQKVISAFELKYLRQIMQQAARQNHWPWRDLFAENVVHKDDAYPVRNAALAQAAAEEVQRLGEQRWGKKTDVLKHKDAPDPVARCTQVEKWVTPLQFWPGRREFWPKIKHARPDDQWFFIGGHNNDGLRKMIIYLQQTKLPITTVLASFSQRPWHDLKINLTLLGQIPGSPKIVLVAFDHPKAVTLAELQNLAREVCLAVPVKVECWHQQLEENLGHESGTTLVTGSFYLVGLVQRSLLRQYGRSH